MDNGTFGIPPPPPIEQVCFFVVFFSIYQCTTVNEATRLMSKMVAMASHGQQVSLLSCCLHGEGN
jgi:hypothetical protein